MPVKDEMVEKKPRCLTTNSLPLTELTGEAENFMEYTPSITKRKNGVNSLVDTLGILNNLRLFKDVEKVLSLQTKDDELTPSPRAKEYLKRCMELVKGK